MGIKTIPLNQVLQITAKFLSEMFKTGKMKIFISVLIICLCGYVAHLHTKINKLNRLCDSLNWESYELNEKIRRHDKQLDEIDSKLSITATIENDVKELKEAVYRKYDYYSSY